MYSIIVPLFNHARFIERTLSSALEQTCAAREIIVIDDGSTDNSAEKAAQFAQRDSRILFWRQANRGAHAAINAGLYRATSEIVTILNSDDIYEPHRMEVAIRRLAADKSVAAVATELSSIDEHDRHIANPWYENSLKKGLASDDMAIALLDANYFVTTSNLVFRRTVFDRIGGFYQLRYAHDLEFFTRMLHAGFKIEFLKQSLLKYRVHSANTIKEGQHKVRVEWAAIIAWNMTRIICGASNAGLEFMRLQRMLRIIEVHNLGKLVQWMSLVCEWAMQRGVSIFELAEWPKLAKQALEIEE